MLSFLPAFPFRRSIPISSVDSLRMVVLRSGKVEDSQGRRASQGWRSVLRDRIGSMSCWRSLTFFGCLATSRTARGRGDRQPGASDLARRPLRIPTRPRPPAHSASCSRACRLRSDVADAEKARPVVLHLTATALDRPTIGCLACDDLLAGATDTRLGTWVGPRRTGLRTLGAGGFAATRWAPKRASTGLSVCRRRFDETLRPEDPRFRYAGCPNLRHPSPTSAVSQPPAASRSSCRRTDHVAADRLGSGGTSGLAAAARCVRITAPRRQRALAEGPDTAPATLPQILRYPAHGFGARRSPRFRQGSRRATAGAPIDLDGRARDTRPTARRHRAPRCRTAEPRRLGGLEPGLAAPRGSPRTSRPGVARRGGAAPGTRGDLNGVLLPATRRGQPPSSAAAARLIEGRAALRELLRLRLHRAHSAIGSSLGADDAGARSSLSPAESRARPTAGHGRDWPTGGHGRRSARASGRDARAVGATLMVLRRRVGDSLEDLAAPSHSDPEIFRWGFRLFSGLPTVGPCARNNPASSRLSGIGAFSPSRRRTWRHQVATQRNERRASRSRPRT